MLIQSGGLNASWWPFGGALALDQVLNEYVVPIVFFVITLAVVYILGRAILVPLVERILKRQGHAPAVQSLAGNVMGVVVWLLAIALAFTVAGFGSVIAAFGIFAGAIALAIGFAAQDLLGNFVAGVFILKDEPFNVGDWIDVVGVEGEVTEIDLRVTRVRTFDNELVTVPNSDLSNNPLTNPVAFDTLRMKFVFGIGYDDDIDHAKSAILDEASANEDILDDPGPAIRVTELAGSYVGLQTRFWIADPSRSEYMRVQSDFVQAVKERIDAESIDMPYPHRQLVGGISIDGGRDVEDVSN